MSELVFDIELAVANVRITNPDYVLYDCHRPPAIMGRSRVDSSLSIAVIEPPHPPSPSPPLSTEGEGGKTQFVWF
jgi:hypothetical protein